MQLTLALLLVLVPVILVVTAAVKPVRVWQTRPDEFVAITSQGGYNDARAIAFLAEDALVATGAGVCSVNRETKRWAHPDWLLTLPIRNLSGIVVEENEVWVSSYTMGLAHYVDGKWDTLTAPDALPSNVVTDIELAPDGSIWIGTAQGLVALGTEDPALSSVVQMLRNTPILSISLLGEKCAIATPTDVLVFRDWPDTTYERYSPRAVGDRHIATVSFEGPDLWCVTDGGIYRITETSWEQYYFITDITGQNVWGSILRCGIAALDDDVIAFGLETDYRGGLAVLSNGEWYVQETGIGYLGEQVRDVALDVDGTLWIASDTGLVTVCDNSTTWHRDSSEPPINSVVAVHAVSSEEFWAASENTLCHWESGCWESITVPSDIGEIKDLLCDRTGRLWIAGSNAVSYYSDNSFTIFNEATGLRGRDASCLVEGRDERIWIGFPGVNPAKPVAVGAYDGKNWLWVECKEDTWKNDVNALFIDPSDQVWVGSSSGVWQAEPVECEGLENEPSDDSSYVQALTADRDGNIMIGTLRGLYTLRDHEWSGPMSGLGTTDIRALALDHDGVLWVGTDDGLAKLSEQEISIFRIAHGLPSNYIADISICPDGTLLVATDRGLGIRLRF